MAAKKHMQESLSNEQLDKKSRGTNDDLEILMIILKENPVIRMRVMERIRSMRNEIKVRDAAAAKN